MKDKDKALSKVVNNLPAGELPSNFTFQMMNKINAEAVKEKARAEKFGYILLIATSIGLIGIMVFVLTYFYSFNPWESLRNIEFNAQNESSVCFYIYIATAALALLGLDYWLRRYREKHLK